MSTSFTMPLTVQPDHIDVMNHVNNVAFVKMIQDVAAQHWLTSASREIRDEFTWVCRRHEIDYFKPGFLGEQLELKTWVGEPIGATWERFTEITRPKDAAILVTARTVWVLLDVATGRPRRVDSVIRNVLN